MTSTLTRSPNTAGPQGTAGTDGSTGATGATGPAGISSPDALYPGTNLADNNTTISPGTNGASEYTLPAATLTTNRTCTVDTAGSSLMTELSVWIIRRDLTANPYEIINGGIGGGTIVTLPPSPARPMGACLYYDGTNWTLTSLVYLQP